jgi:hypothetical protein
VKYVITEFGAEDISDDHPYTATLPKTNNKQIGGVHTLEKAWRHLHPHSFVSVADTYMREIQKAIGSGMYLESGCIVGVCLFSWGVGGRWADYDVSGMTDLHQMIVDWSHKLTPPPVVEPPAPPVIVPPPDVEDTTEVPATPVPCDPVDYTEIERIINVAIDRKLGPLMRLLAVLLDGLTVDRVNEARLVANVVNEVRSEIEKLYPEEKGKVA